jgi:3-deoxy-D-manno-octulosonic-acid transferase
MKIFLKIIYTYIFLPFLFILAFVVSGFSKTIRKAFFERFKVIKKLKNYKASQTDSKNYILIHCASMGEFEHIKPLITQLSASKRNAIIITFFSSSGYENVKNYEGVDLILYIPFDFPGQWKKFYNTLNPKFLVISKHDAWPNQIWIAEENNIPIFLVNASLHENSSRIKGLAKILYNEVYQAFNQIHAVSESNKKNFERHFKNIHVDSLGDTKFDQVSLRKRQSINIKYIPDYWLKDELIILLGSVWPEDLSQLIEPVKNILLQNSNVKVIIAPHQPNEKHIDEIKNTFAGIELIYFSRTNFSDGSKILLIDTVGILADLYKYAHIAYVGGSFKQGIHNVMEPAIYGIPVIFGPTHSNSIEAEKLLKRGGGIQVNNKNDVQEVFNKLLNDTSFRRGTGEKALSYALENTGVSEQLINEWQKYLD